MFSSGGYFRSANCPFFVYGLCHRPYCHFRHAKPGICQSSASKSTLSKSCLKPKDDLAKSEENSLPAHHEDNTQVTLPQEAIPKHSTKPDDKLRKVEQKPKSVTPDKTLSILASLDKLEQAVEEVSASLLTHVSTKTPSSVAGKIHSTIVETTPDLNPKNASLATNTASDGTQCTSSNKEGNKEGNNSTCKVGNEEVLVIQNEIPEQEQNVGKSTDSYDIQGTGPQCKNSTVSPSKNITSNSKTVAKDFNVSEEILTIISSKLNLKGKVNSVEQDSIAKTLKADDVEIHEIRKSQKRKSSESDTLEVKVKRRNSKDTYKKVSTKHDAGQITLKHNDLESGEKKKVCVEKNVMKSMTVDSKRHTMAEKHPQKVKPELKTVDIDFFRSPKKKKANRIEIKERTKNRSGISSHKDEEKPQKSEQLKKLHKNYGGKNPIKVPKEVARNSTVNSISVQRNIDRKSSSCPGISSVSSLFESSDEATFSSDSFSDSDSEDNVDSSDTLREIFNNYDPKKDAPSTSVSRKHPRESSTSVSVRASPVKERDAGAPEMLGLGKKPRVAHNPSYLVQRKSSNLNPVRRLPKAPNRPASTISNQSTPPKEIDLLQGKKRVAHAPKPTTETSLARPRIAIEYGAKVPQNFRQRYLDKIIDENLRICVTEREAFVKAVHEEREIYNRSARRHIYLNLCINAIKKLRSITTLEHRPAPTLPIVSTATVTRPSTSTTVEISSPKKIDISHLTEEMFYELLSKYILDEEELVENGFPRQSPTSPGKVTFKLRKPQTNNNKDPNRRICCRCGRPYTVRDDGTYVRPEECVYHVGRLLKRRTAGEVSTSYQCCGGDSTTPGCAVCKFHVCDGKNTTDGFMTTITSPLAGKQRKIFALDCEMCYTIAGLELTRATVVDWKLDKIYDTFVRPDNTILDYNTRFSGVTAECLRGVKTSIREVQAVLLSMINKDSILVGHSLESDLLALKLVHATVVDTSVVFPHRLGPPYKRALRTLTAEYLKQIIQDNEAGHDSYEDAKAGLELMLHKAKEDLKIKERSRR